MVHVIRIGESTYYSCSECELVYKKLVDARLCEEWCREHRTCNTIISKRAVGSVRQYTGLRIQ